MASETQRLSALELKEILGLPGNSRCFDCNKAFALSSELWSSVPYGTLLCTKCARFHEESLLPKGAVKSLVMDFLTPRQVLALRIGSNSQLKGFFQRQHIEHTAPELLYKMSAAVFYRRQLALELRRRLGPKLPAGQLEPTDNDAMRLMMLLCNNGNARPSAEPGDCEFAVKLETMVSAATPLGLTLTETHGGRAVVQRVAADGIARASGIVPGDYIVGVGSEREWRFSVVLPRIAAWAAPSKTKENAASRKCRSLTLVMLRPRWRPDAFIMQTVQAEQDNVDDVDEKLDRTTALLAGGPDPAPDHEASSAPLQTVASPARAPVHGCSRAPDTV